MKTLILQGLTLCTLLAGCAGTAPERQSFRPIPPATDAVDLDIAIAQARALSGTPQTAPFHLPTGTAIYHGQVGADVAGDSAGVLLGDMRMEVGFATNSVSGEVRNIDLVEQTALPDQQLQGQLDIAGFETAGRLDAGAAGRLTGVDGNGDLIGTDVFLDMSGAVRNAGGYGDAVYGSVIGTAEGDIDLDLTGAFFGTRR